MMGEKQSAEHQKIPQSLESERLLLQTLVHTLPDLIFQKDRHGRFVFANQSFARAVGLGDPKEIVGRTDLDFFPRQMALKYMSDDRIVLETGRQEVNIEEPFLTTSGSVLWVLTTKVPLFDGSQRVTGLFGMCRDITRRKELEKRNQQLATIVESSDDAIVGFDLDRRITTWNKGAELLLGYTEEEMIGAPTSRTIPPELEEQAHRMRERVIQGEKVVRYETTRLRKDGSRIIVSLTLSAIRDAENRILGIASIAHDITERTLAEESLRETEMRLAAIVEFLPDATFAIDQKGIVIAWNQAMEEMTGVAAKEMLGKGNYEYAIPFYQERRPILIDLVRSLDADIGNFYRNVLQREKDILIAEVPFPRLRDRENVFLWGKASVLYDSKGRVAGAIESIRDVTELRREQEALHASEERYRNLVQNLGEGLAVVDQSGRIQFANPAAEKIFTRPPGGLVGINVADYVGKEKAAKIFTAIGHVHRGGNIADTLTTTGSDGRTRTLEYSASPQFDHEGGFAASLFAFRDCTEQRRLEESLEQERKLLLTLINNLPDYIYLKDREGKFVLVNQAQARLAGASDPRELIDTSDYDYLPKDLADKHRSDEVQVMERARSLVNIEEQNQDAAGKPRWVLTTKVPLVGVDGKVTGLVGIGRDITERKGTEEALRESNKKYHLLLDTLNEGVWAIDERDATMFVNPRMASMMGCTEEELLGKNIFGFLRAPSLAAERERAGVERASILGQFDGEFQRKDGSRIITRLKIAPIMGARGEYLGSIASVIDITEQRKAEGEVQQLQKQLLQAQKMEAIGRLAGGVAHDFNNLLTTILGNVELIRTEKSSHGVIGDLAQEVQKAALRAAELTHQLLAFSRKQMLQPKTLDLNGLVENLSKMLRRLIGEDIELELRLDPEAGSVKADPGQIEQVILNLAVNARDAMALGGRLILETLNVETDGEPLSGCFEIPAGPYVIMKVSDTGAGMDETVKAHLFEPFFTTKDLGKGTGLGLSTVYGIVKQSGGYIAVDSRPGQGTSFTILLPRVYAGTASMEALDIQHRPRGGTERVLIVEDEPSVLRLVTRMLKSLGYTVFSACCPDDALSLPVLDERGGPDLLLADVVLPGMKGTELARRMQERMPGLRVLFISGYTDETTFHEEVLSEGGAFLLKPFSREVLGNKVREVLDRPRARRGAL
jgi:two-component system, cell cycle sensor histidine kinase and response regulator CckA